MILYTEEQFDAAYKEYRYFHMKNKRLFLSTDKFREMFEEMMRVVYIHEVEDYE
tara:strand:+ start:43 stop:204 length:162 start_codon:yes stop_codon:yes gene_type:complete